MPASRYLIVRLAALGDVAMASAIPEAIRRREPDAHVTWLCGERVAELVSLFVGVDEVLTVDEASLLRGRLDRRLAAVLGVWRRLAFRRFDAILLGHGDARYRALVMTTRTSRTRGLVHLPTPRMLPVPGRYYGDEYVRLLDRADRPGPVVGRTPLSDVRAKLAPRRDTSPVGVVLVPGGARNVLRESALRRWPVERYRDVAVRLRSAGYPVTLIGDAGDDWVRATFAGVDVRDEIGAHGIAATLSLMNAADLVISHDTGPLHLARLVRAPLLALFGPTIPSQFVPDDDRATQVLWGGAALACRPCYDGREFAPCRDNLCMQDIATDVVVERALAMLATGRHAW